MEGQSDKGLKNNLSIASTSGPSKQDGSRDKQTTTSSSESMKSERGNDLLEPNNMQTMSSQAPSAYPKKKGGFVITSVKDNLDGDESADELDESHADASYSDISYSRTTDIDHDQESTASEDTLNMTLQENLQPLDQGKIINASIPAVTDLHGPYDSSQKVLNETSKFNPLQDIKQDNKADKLSVTDESVKTGTTSQPQLPTSKDNLHDKPPVTATTLQQSSGAMSTTTASKTTTTATGAANKGAIRMYKFVKRDTHQPVKKEKSRWVCYDFLDAHAPNYSFVAHSASDSRITFPDQSHLVGGAPSSSLPGGSIMSSSSTYSLQHSDSNSSIHRDAPVMVGSVSAAQHGPVQHSASTSSVNYDMESRKAQTAVNNQMLQDMSDDPNAKSSADDRMSDTMPSDADILKAVGVVKSGIQGISDNQSIESEDDQESSRNVRIDNRIEAAMDLVKKHLMSAVRDEVDELKDKIVELQEDNFKMKIENEVMRTMLTSEQQPMLQQKINEAMSKSMSKKSSQPLQAFQPNQQLQTSASMSSKPAQPAPVQSFPLAHDHSLAAQHQPAPLGQIQQQPLGSSQTANIGIGSPVASVSALPNPSQHLPLNTGVVRPMHQQQIQQQAAHQHATQQQQHAFVLNSLQQQQQQLLQMQTTAISTAYPQQPQQSLYHQSMPFSSAPSQLQNMQRQVYQQQTVGFQQSPMMPNQQQQQQPPPVSQAHQILPASHYTLPAVAASSQYQPTQYQSALNMGTQQSMLQQQQQQQPVAAMLQQQLTQQQLTQQQTVLPGRQQQNLLAPLLLSQHQQQQQLPTLNQQPLHVPSPIMTLAHSQPMLTSAATAAGDHYAAHHPSQLAPAPQQPPVPYASAASALSPNQAPGAGAADQRFGTQT